MKLAIIAPGSRGDVQPYVALGKGLRNAGHAVWLVSTEDFRELAINHGLEFVSMGDSAQGLAQEHIKGLAEQGNLLKILSATGRGARLMARQGAIAGLEACQGVDAILGGLGGLSVGMALAEKLSLPFLQAYLMPFTPTREFASVLTPALPRPLARLTNRLTHHLARQMMWQMVRSANNQARVEILGLPRASFWGPFAAQQHSDVPILYGYSPAVVPVPTDWARPIHVTGYWQLDTPEAWAPPTDLLSFLEAGPPPVYIGFGSMTSLNPEATAELVLEALRRSGQRGVVYAGWGGLQKADIPDSVLMIGSTPHSWLFPRMAAVVHHGGAGTTAAGLSAGVPSIITPFFGDQPFWGRRVAELGVGPQPIPRRRLTAGELAKAIERAVHDRALRERAAALGARLRAEDGVGRAAAVLAAWAGTGQTGRA